MEDILSVYQRDYSTENPLVCMDETSKQLTKETRNSIPANSNHVEYYDTEYQRNGNANLFMFLTPSRASDVLMLTEVVQLKNGHIKLNNWSISITLMQKK